QSRCAERLREGTVSRFVVGGRDGVPLEPGSLLLSPLERVGQEGGGPGEKRAREPGGAPRARRVCPGPSPRGTGGRVCVMAQQGGDRSGHEAAALGESQRRNGRPGQGDRPVCDPGADDGRPRGPAAHAALLSPEGEGRREYDQKGPFSSY